MNAPENLAAMKDVDLGHLTEAMDALNRIPQPVRSEVSSLCAEHIGSKFRTYLSAVSESRTSGPMAKPSMIAHSAQLAGLSLACHAAALPWHVATPEELQRIADLIRDRGDMDGARKALMSLKPVSLYVAASSNDDRDSYLEAVAQIAKERRVMNLVFDGEIIEWSPHKEFLEACAKVGMPPIYIGICDRAAVADHGMLKSSAILLDTSGRALGSSAPAAHSAAPKPPSSNLSGRIAQVKQARAASGQRGSV